MKLLLVLSGIFALLSMGARAEAQNYPWCAIYGGFDDGGTNCGFTTFEQCMATARGIRQSGFKGAIHIKPVLVAAGIAYSADNYCRARICRISSGTLADVHCNPPLLIAREQFRRRSPPRLAL